MARKKFNSTEQSIINGLKESLGFAARKTKAKTHNIKVPMVNVNSARTKLGLTQEEFASTFGVSVSTIQNWEQGRRNPTGAAKVLHNVIQLNPDAVKLALDQGDITSV